MRTARISTSKKPKGKSARTGALSYAAVWVLHHREELDEEEEGDDIGQNADVLGLAGEDLDHGVGDQAQTDGVADGAGHGHTDEHDGHRQHLIHIVEVDVLEALEHQHADVDERGGGRSAGDDGGDGGEEHAGEEENGGGQRGQTGAAAGLHAGGGFDKGGNGGGASGSARDRTDGVGEQGLLHVGHLALLIHHAGAGGGAHQSADGVEHIDHAEGDDQRDGGEPADVHKARKVKLEERGRDHVGEGRHEACGLKACKGIHAEECEAADPIKDGGKEHTKQHGGLDALLGQHDHDEHTEKRGHDGQDHRVIARTHVALDDTGGQGAEEVAHHVERTAVFGIDTNVGAKTHVHQHQADGRGDAVAHAERDGLHDLLAHLQHGEHKEHDAFDEDDDEGSLKSAGVVAVIDHGDVGHHHSEEAVETHAGRHGKGLVGQEGHAGGADGGGDAGCKEHAVPQRRADREAGEQIGVQGDDVGHRHERGQARQDLCPDGSAVLFQFKDFFHSFPLSLIIGSHKGPPLL